MFPEAAEWGWGAGMTDETGTSSRHPSFRVARVPERLRSAAAKRLLGPGRGTSESARHFLSAAQTHGIDLTHFWATLEPSGDAVRHVCLAVVGPGRSAMTFTSTPTNQAEEREISALVGAALSQVSGVQLAQALLEVDEQASRAALVGAGFSDVGILAYMRRPTPSRWDGLARHSVWPEGVFVRRYQSNDDGQLIAGLDRSYAGTLDCPELCGMRETADVLESHRAAGRWDPAHWWVAERDRKIEGMLLFNPSPEMGSIELVYLGLSPSLRGTGIGRRLLEHGLAHLVGRPESQVTCAVDERNEPALRLYRRAGFEEFARRVALVKPVARGGKSAASRV